MRELWKRKDGRFKGVSARFVAGKLIKGRGAWGKKHSVSGLRFLGSKLHRFFKSVDRFAGHDIKEVDGNGSPNLAKENRLGDLFRKEGSEGLVAKWLDV